MTSSLHKSDLDLAKRVAVGDEMAFREFFQAYFPRLYRFALARNGDAAFAEETAQATLCKVMGKLGQYRGEASLFTWLCQICRNEMSAHFRRANTDPARHVPLEETDILRAALESLSSGMDDPEVFSRGQETARLVQVVLDHLPANYCRVLELKYLAGDRVSAIAGVLGVSEKAAESMLSRARIAFKDAFVMLYGNDASELLHD